MLQLRWRTIIGAMGGGLGPVLVGTLVLALAPRLVWPPAADAGLVELLARGALAALPLALGWRRLRTAHHGP